MAAPAQLQALLKAVNTLLRERRYHAVLALLKGFRNGAVYGVKIRAPHALVMTFLFRRGSLQEKLQAVLKATYTHSRNLACFVFTYKSLCALQSHVQGETHQMHSFLAAFLGGLLVFGKNNNVNSQENKRRRKLLERNKCALCLACPSPQPALASCPDTTTPPPAVGGGRLHRRLALLSKNRLPSQMASLWILPEHLVPPTAHSREEGGVVPTERSRTCLQQLWEEPSFTPS